MNKEELYFESKDGVSKIHAVRYIPDCKPVAIVQIIHGMAEYIERYEPFAEFLCERGIIVTGEDHLGHGHTCTDGKYGYFCKNDPATVVVRDAHRLKKLNQEKYPELPYIIMGHSMGSFIARNYIERYGTGVVAGIIMGTGSQPKALLAVSKCIVATLTLFKGEYHKSNFITNLAFGAYNKRIENAKTANDWLSVNDENVTKYNADSLCGFTFTLNGYKTLFTLIDRCQKPSNIEEIPKKLPLLFVAGEEDPVGAYGVGVKTAYDNVIKAGALDAQLKMYPGMRHEILNEKNAAVVMNDIYEFIKTKVLKEA